MVDPKQRSRKRSSGSSAERSTSRPHNFTFYLDENWDCPEVIEELERAGVKYRLYSQDVAANAGVQDTALFPKVGQRGWILITADRSQRTRLRELADMQRYRVRHFALPANLGAIGMARLLIKAKNNIRECCRENEPFISATVLRDGSVRLVHDRKGILQARGEEKIYRGGKLVRPRHSE